MQAEQFAQADVSQFVREKIARFACILIGIAFRELGATTWCCYLLRLMIFAIHVLPMRIIPLAISAREHNAGFSQGPDRNPKVTTSVSHRG